MLRNIWKTLLCENGLDKLRNSDLFYSIKTNTPCVHSVMILICVNTHVYIN